MGILNIDEHVEEHRLLEIRYPEKAVMIGTATASVPASKTLSFDDAGKFLICDSGSAIVLTVPSDATAGWIDAVTIAACRKGVGAVTFAAGAAQTPLSETRPTSTSFGPGFRAPRQGLPAMQKWIRSSSTALNTRRRWHNP